VKNLASFGLIAVRGRFKPPPLVGTTTEAPVAVVIIRGFFCGFDKSRGAFGVPAPDEDDEEEVDVNFTTTLSPTTGAAEVLGFKVIEAASVLVVDAAAVVDSCSDLFGDLVIVALSRSPAVEERGLGVGGGDWRPPCTKIDGSDFEVDDEASSGKLNVGTFVQVESWLLLQQLS